MDPLRIVARYTRPKDMVPVEKKDTGRTVYVLPDTLKNKGKDYQPLQDSDLNTQGKPAPKDRPGQPELPKKPTKPHKPEIPRDKHPAPIHPPIPVKQRKPPIKPKPVPLVDPPKVPEPSEPKRWERRKPKFSLCDVPGVDSLARKVAEVFIQKAIELPVPLYHQITSYSCGAGALVACILYWKQEDRDWEYEPELWERLGTTEENGTEPQEIVRVAREHGLGAHYYQKMNHEDMRRHLDAGDTVILCLQAWPDHPTTQAAWKSDWEDGHYVVLVGMDAQNVYLMDPSTHASYTWIPLPELMNRWHDVDRTTPRQHIAIAIRGTTPMKTFPGPLAYLD